ncbi:MAG: DUF2852 domain-containing protein [Hyphomicrobium sp.]
MPFFHFFGPPHAFHFAALATAALAGAAVAYVYARSRFPLIAAMSSQNEARDPGAGGARSRSLFSRGARCSGNADRSASRSGEPRNAAFEEYRRETLAKLETESAEFSAYLTRLKHAADKAEFERFMSERRQGPAS